MREWPGVPNANLSASALPGASAERRTSWADRTRRCDSLGSRPIGDVAAEALKLVAGALVAGLIIVKR
jgi:hypothetical protein